MVQPTAPVAAANVEIIWRHTIRAFSAQIGLAWMSKSAWINERIDMFEYRDATTARCNTSIDLIIPEVAPILYEQSTGRVITAPPDGQPARAVPIAWLSKGALPFEFDLRDESDRTLTRIRWTDSAHIVGTILIMLATGTIGVDIPRDLEGRLREIATREEPRDGDDEWRRLISGDWEMSQTIKSKLFSEAEFRFWVKAAAENYLLCTLLVGDPGRQHTVKIQYNSEQGGLESFPRKMGWQDWVFEFRAPAAEAASYKFEVSVPEGIRITHLTLMAIGDTQPPTGATGASYTRINHRNGVISVSGCTEDAEYVSSGRLRVEPGGWIRTAAYCGLAIIALLIFARVFASRFELKDSDRHTDIVFLFSTFLFVVGTAVVTMLIRVGEHQLMTKMLEYLRFTATAFAIPSFGAVLALVFCGNSGQLKQFIIGFALFAGLLDALLFYALYRKSKT